MRAERIPIPTLLDRLSRERARVRVELKRGAGSCAGRVIGIDGSRHGVLGNIVLADAEVEGRKCAWVVIRGPSILWIVIEELSG